MRIGEVARESGVPTKTIRYYEDIGVLPEPERADNGYREYGTETVDRLRFVRDAQATGLSLTEISSILDLRGRGETTCHHVIDLLERHLSDLDRHINNLRETRDHLAVLTIRARDLDPAECTDPNRCQTISEDTGISMRKPRRGGHLHLTPQSHPRQASEQVTRLNAEVAERFIAWMDEPARIIPSMKRLADAEPFDE